MIKIQRGISLALLETSIIFTIIFYLIVATFPLPTQFP